MATIWRAGPGGSKQSLYYPLTGWKRKAGLSRCGWDWVVTKWLAYLCLVAHSEFEFNLFNQVSLYNLSHYAVMWNTAFHTFWNAVTEQKRSPGQVHGNTSVYLAPWIWMKMHDQHFCNCKPSFKKYQKINVGCEKSMLMKTWYSFLLKTSKHILKAYC